MRVRKITLHSIKAISLKLLGIDRRYYFIIRFFGFRYSMGLIVCLHIEKEKHLNQQFSKFAAIDFLFSFFYLFIALKYNNIFTSPVSGVF